MMVVPEGSYGEAPYKCASKHVIHQRCGCGKAASGYTGSLTIEDLQKRAPFVQITNAGLSESHVHDVTITREAPNYPTREGKLSPPVRERGWGGEESFAISSCLFPSHSS